MGELAVGPHSNVVFDDQRPHPGRGHERLEIDIAPVEVGSESDTRGTELDLAGDADTHAANLGGLDVRFLQYGLDSLNDAPEHRGGTTFG